MTKKVTTEEVASIASLAMIALTPDEIERYRKQFESILEYVDILNEIDTDTIEAKNHTELKNIFKEDIVKEELTQKDALINREEIAINGYFPITSVFTDNE